VRAERRYARAFLEAASAEDIKNLLEAAEQLQKGNALLYLSLPTFPLHQKEEFLKSFLPSLSENVERFLFLLLRKRRIILLPAIVEELLRLKKEMEGIEEAYVHSAIPLTPEERERLKRALEKRSGKRIILNEDVDPSLIGGLVVEIEGTMIDMSLKGFLLRLQTYLIRREVKK